MNIEKRLLDICKQHGVEPVPVFDEQLIVVSKGVFEGDPVEGVRYPSPNHMSGWWLTTDQYDGNTDNLFTEHIYHLYERRPELMRFMSLPYGFRFRIGKDYEDVWFDEKVASEQF